MSPSTPPPVNYAVSLLAALSLASQVFAQEASAVRINEIVASNVTTFPDNIDFDDYSDWIELYNDSENAVSLEGYFLTDDLTVPLKWPIPAGASIPAKGYFTVRADGFDSAPGERVRRDFAPWDDFTTDYYHTNFKLSELGEEVGLFKLDGVIETIGLIELGATWRYLDDGSDLGTAWRESGFDDDTWSIGSAQFGYGENDQRTTVLYGNDEDNKYPTTYFRTTFQIDDVSGLASLDLRILVDDGAIIYLNGQELSRVRMPDGDAAYDTLATVRAPEDLFDSFQVAPSLLREGTNHIAVEVHQVVTTTSDMSFDIELSTKRVPVDFEAVDSVTFAQQTSDVSYGRDPETGEWVNFGEPTPLQPNTTPAVTSLAPSSEVTFSVEGGFYTGTQTVSLATTSDAATIHYTLDGSWPTSSSAVYDLPLAIATTTPVRARAFDPGSIPGELATQTYFIDEPERSLPVVSFVVDPEIFFDDTLGIYENVHKGREAPMHLEWFAEDRSLAFATNAGTKIGGENIWRFAQKPLNVALRGKYGNDAVNYQIFPTERIGTYSRISFRNGGDNWDDDMLRDALTPDLMRGQMANDVETYRPVVLYMNGNYWGVHNARKDLSPEYFAATYQVDPTDYDHLEYGHVTSSAVTLGAKEGDNEDYLALEAYADDNDLSDPAHFAFMETRMDMESFMDFIIIEDFVNNTSWRHNREFWRERKDGAKWRWIVPDLDRGLNYSNVESSLLDNFDDSFDLFEQLMDNDGFKNRLAQRYAAHLGSTFHPDRIAAIVDMRDAEVRDEMLRHIAKWRGDDGIQSMEDRQDELDEIKRFARDRPEHIYSDFRQNFDMPQTAQMTVDVSPAGGGRVLLNGVPMLPEYGNQVDLFLGLPADAVAQPAPGYTFAGWSSGEADAKLEFSIDSGRSLTATFVPEGETLLAGTVAAGTTLDASGSPYSASGDIIVPQGTTLTIEAGTHITLQPNADIRVAGTLIVNGTEEAPVRIESRLAGRRWGSLAFVDSEGTSTLSHLIVRGGSVGGDPVLERGAISMVRSTVEIDHLDIDDVLIPIFGWESNVILRSSRVHTAFTGDGINIKHGEGLVEDSTFIGNDAPDTDAIDFDDVVDGVIRNNRIYAYRGPNSDGIDVGEGCVDLLVSGNRIYNISDKGISVGQGSTVRIERNLIVGCVLGVGIKDTGSFATINQNTFAQCGVPVAIFEKNYGAGGGGAAITNTIFSRSKKAPVTVDSLSKVAVSYSLSDTLPIEGIGNTTGDAAFVDPGSYDFSLTDVSPAIDAGDPAHTRDGDGSLADLGAYYVFDPDDYPFHVPNVVVINEVLSHSHDDAPDWIELHNTSNAPIDISGWFLSDSKSDLHKYRIADETILPAGGFLVFYEDETFGEASTDPGKTAAFALSENGESVYLFAPGDGILLDYLEEESFGPSPTGVSRGRYLKSTNTYNFVSMTTPTPGAVNSAPQVGPVVISEIMYRPNIDGDAEYLELTNIGNDDVLLYDAVKDESWRFSDGIVFDFPKTEPVTIAARERILLVRDETAFRAQYEVGESVRVFQWTSGALKNSGERIEFSSPGDVDANGDRLWIRVDRVNYGDSEDGFWPPEADGSGMSLTRVDDSAYGNDPVNWIAAEPTPGIGTGTEPGSAFAAWAAETGLPAGADRFTDDADGDGLTNGLEYALGLDALKPGITPELEWSIGGAGADSLELNLPVSATRPDVTYEFQMSSTLRPDSWVNLPTATEASSVSATVSPESGQAFFRLSISLATP